MKTAMATAVRSPNNELPDASGAMGLVSQMSIGQCHR